MRNFIVVLLACSACKWTAFDDLKEEAWVNATDAPDNGSTNWGIALVKSTSASASGGRVTVLGTAKSIYNEIEYGSTGSSKIAGTELDLGDLGVANLEQQPILLADPTKDGVSIVTKRGPQEVLVLEGTQGMLTGHQVFGADSADTAAYMVAPGIDGGATPQPAQPILASADTLFGTFFNPPDATFQQTKCKLVEGANPIAIRALGAARFGANTTDDVIVWAGSGKLYLVNGQVFNGPRSGPPGGPFVCPDDGTGDAKGTFDVTAVPQVDVGFGPDLASQVLVFGGHFALLQGHNNQTGASFLGLVDLGDGTANPTLVGNPQTETGLKTAAVFEGTTIAAVAGYPTAVVDGVNCGKVVVYTIDTAVGIDPNPVEVLNDAQPDDGQSFGRAVAVIPFNGQPILVVAASNEVFAYFRTSTLYPDDTRQGR